jgi:hypothetical protein
MHRALQDFGPHERSMRRVTIQGDVPYFAEAATAARATAASSSKL